jgi:very-short-patch-repair endonuclease
LKTAYAAQQQKNASDAARKLWSILRRKQIAGEPSKRQEPIGPYLVDFYCPGAKFVIALDDGLPGKGRDLDAQTQWLTSQGYTVLRLNAEDVRRDASPTLKHLGRKFRMRDMPRSDSSEWASGPSNRT